MVEYRGNNLNSHFCKELMTKVPWVFVVRRPRFSFSKLKMSFPTSVPTWLIYSLIYISVFYIYIGGVYNVLENPIAFASDAQNNIALIANGIDRQFLLEGVVAGLLMFLGAFGFFLMKDASKDYNDKSRFYYKALPGWILAIGAFFAITAMMGVKL